MASSLDFAPIDCDMDDDPKVSWLLDELGGASGRAAVYGSLVLVMQRIYKNGFYLPYGRFERIKLAKDLAMTVEELDGFLSACVDAELLDAGMYGLGVLTSNGIQERYFRARKSRVVSDDDARYVIGAQSDAERDSPKSSEELRKAPKNSEKLRDSPKNAEPSEEKRREVKRSKGKKTPRAASGSSSSGSGQGFSGIGGLVHPLPCMAEVSDPSGAYFDLAGGEHDTPWDALEASFAHAARGQPILPFAAGVAELCPKGCACSLGDVERCARLLQGALAKFDPARSSSPLPLARRIIADERGGATC